MTKLAELHACFDQDRRARYRPDVDGPEGDAFRATLLVTALSEAFASDLRDEFRALDFPVDDAVFDELSRRDCSASTGGTWGGWSVAGAAGSSSQSTGGGGLGGSGSDGPGSEPGHGGVSGSGAGGPEQSGGTSGAASGGGSGGATRSPTIATGGVAVEPSADAADDGGCRCTTLVSGSSRSRRPLSGWLLVVAVLAYRGRTRRGDRRRRS